MDSAEMQELSLSFGQDREAADLGKSCEQMGLNYSVKISLKATFHVAFRA
jgi:hypothetical protein